MEKDFEEWHKEKAVLHKKTKTVFFHEREIWWCALGANVGNEQDGKGALFTRPVLILKKFSKTTFWAVPLTTKRKQGTYFYSLSSRVGGRRTTAVLHQLRLIDARRLSDKLGYATKQDFANIKKSVSDLLH
jgi:mRNA interferase MazF